MSGSDEFIEKYGQDLFDELFECVSDKRDLGRVKYIYSENLDREGINQAGLCLIDGVLLVEFENGNWNGSVIHNFYDDELHHWLTKTEAEYITKNRISLNRDIKLNEIFKYGRLKEGS